VYPVLMISNKLSLFFKSSMKHFICPPTLYKNTGPGFNMQNCWLQ